MKTTPKLPNLNLFELYVREREKEREKEREREREREREYILYNKTIGGNSLSQSIVGTGSKTMKRH